MYIYIYIYIYTSALQKLRTIYHFQCEMEAWAWKIHISDSGIDGGGLAETHAF